MSGRMWNMPEVFAAPEKRNKKERYSQVYHQLENEKGSGSFRAFAINPTDLRFETQEPDEKIILLLRQHPIVNIGWILIAILMFMVPSLWEFLPFNWLPDRFALMTLVFWYFLVLAFVLEKFLNWYFNVYIVTDERIVDIDFYNLLYRNLSVARLSSIEEVNFSQVGGIAAIFNYGDVYIQTAAEKREQDFLRVPQPARVVEILYMLQQEEHQEELEGRTA